MRFPDIPLQLTVFISHRHPLRWDRVLFFLQHLRFNILLQFLFLRVKLTLQLAYYTLQELLLLYFGQLLFFLEGHSESLHCRD